MLARTATDMTSSDCPEIQFLPLGRAATRRRPLSFGFDIETEVDHESR